MYDGLAAETDGHMHMTTGTKYARQSKPVQALCTIYSLSLVTAVFPLADTNLQSKTSFLFYLSF